MTGTEWINFSPMILKDIEEVPPLFLIVAATTRVDFRKRFSKMWVI